MIRDKMLVLSSAQADITTAATYPCQKSVDLKATAGSIIEDNLWLVVRVGTALATGDSIDIKLCTDAAVTLQTVEGASHKTLASSGAIATASLTANTVVWVVKVPSKLPNRYLGVTYTAVASSAFDAGTIDAFLTPDPELHMAIS